MPDRNSRQFYIEECWRLVHGFFNDDKKTRIWFETKNPLLAYLAPQRMIDVGRERHLLKWIRQQLDDNTLEE